MHPLSPLLPYELWLQIRKIRHNDQVRDYLQTHLEFAKYLESPYVARIYTSTMQRVYLVKLLWMEEYNSRGFSIRHYINSYYKQNGRWFIADGNRAHFQHPMTFGDYQDNEFGVNDDVDFYYSDQDMDSE